MKLNAVRNQYINNITMVTTHHLPHHGHTHIGSQGCCTPRSSVAGRGVVCGCVERVVSVGVRRGVVSGCVLITYWEVDRLLQ